VKDPHLFYVNWGSLGTDEREGEGPFGGCVPSDRVFYGSKITLRDLFAAAALVPLFSNPLMPPENVAALAYEVADAMLREREGGEE